ncbi:MAG: hypothetical protein J6I85_06625 [Clostridia bacterium]|nr:hypothetical protein [Clostridia bacterium]
MPIIITLVISVFLILLSWTWHNLGNIEKSKKVAIIIVLLLLIYIITLIIFNISQKDILYEIQDEKELIKNVFVLLFTLVNGIIVMPMICKTINGVFEKETKKENATTKIMIILVIFIILLFLECGYFKSIQQGILNMLAIKK